MNNISAENVKIGMGLKTWFGIHTVVDIKPYNGAFDFILNILVFSNGTEMSNESHAVYETTNKIKTNNKKKKEMTWKEIDAIESSAYMRGCKGIDY